LSFVAKWRAGTYAIIAMKNSIYSKTYSTTSLRNIKRFLVLEKHYAETFKIKKLKFCEKESVLGYTGTTVNYKFKPLDDILAGKKKKVVVYMVTLTFNSSLLFYYMGNNFSLYEALDN
jgi:hypothetical protein